MATLGLNMIIAGGEADLLRRCLTSVDARETFDEIVIVNTSSDTEIDRTAEAFGASVHAFQWTSPDYPYGDFGGARNWALANSTADYIMWLDADDVVTDSFRPGLGRLRQMFSDPAHPARDIYYLPYVVKHDQDFNPIRTFYRERIFRRDPAIRWLWPVHEDLQTSLEELRTENIDFVQVLHRSEKVGLSGTERNIRIMRHEVEHKKRCGFHNLYFLARDLANHGDLAEAAGLAEHLLAKFPDQNSYLHSLCMTLAFSYAYGRLRTRPALEELVFENRPPIEHWLQAAIRCYAGNAEPWFLLGELHNRCGDLAQAEQMYIKAMEQQLQTGLLQAEPFYAELPGQRLADIYTQAGRPEHALWMNRRALLANRASGTARAQRKAILDTLLKEDF